MLPDGRVTEATHSSLFGVTTPADMLRMAQIADRISVGDAGAPEFPERGGAEIRVLGRSFNRMRKSLDKALKLLEG